MTEEKFWPTKSTAEFYALLQDWEKQFGWTNNSILQKTALLLYLYPDLRDDLNKLLFVFWKKYENLPMMLPSNLDNYNFGLLTRASSILRARRRVAQMIPEFDFKDPVQVENSRRGKGEPPPPSSFEEKNVL